jgi:hypothetical protein
MAGMGLIQPDIATWLKIGVKTLRKYFRRELDTGAIEANMRVASALYANATKHNHVGAQIWWTKARMGWKENGGNDQLAAQSLTFLHLTAMRAFSDELAASRTIDGNVSRETTEDSTNVSTRNLYEPATE